MPKTTDATTHVSSSRQLVKLATFYKNSLKAHARTMPYSIEPDICNNLIYGIEGRPGLFAWTSPENIKAWQQHVGVYLAKRDISDGLKALLKKFNYYLECLDKNIDVDVDQVSASHYYERQAVDLTIAENAITIFNLPKHNLRKVKQLDYERPAVEHEKQANKLDRNTFFAPKPFRTETGKFVDQIGDMSQMKRRESYDDFSVLLQEGDKETGSLSPSPKQCAP